MPQPSAPRGGRGPWGLRRPAHTAVPGLHGAPWVSSALQLRRAPLRLLLEAAHGGGEVVALGRWPRPLYLINHPTLIQQILEHPDHYTKHPNVARITPLFGTGLTTSDGALWRHQRRLVTAAWHAQRLTDLTPLVTAATAEMLARWPPAIQCGQPLDLTTALGDLTQTIMLRVLFGAEAPGPGAAVRAAVQTALAQINQRIWALWVLPLALPTPRNRRLRHALQTLDLFVSQQIHRLCQPGPGPGGLVTRLVAARDDATGEAMPVTQVRDELLTLWMAGHTTMAVALAWTWLLVCQHPVIESRLREEVCHAPWDGLPTTHDLHALPYTRLVLTEALRLYPPTWVTARTPVAPVDLGSVTIPTGAVLLLSPYTMHRHRAFWDEPERYVPERFLREHAMGRPPYVYWPFGGGPRHCLGQGFALRAMQGILALMVRTYRLRLVPGPPVWPAPSLTLQPSRALLCTGERQEPLPRPRR